MGRVVQATIAFVDHHQAWAVPIVFVLAFFVRRVRASGAFFGVLAGEAAIFATAKFTNIAFLWYNAIGCGVVIATALLISAVDKRN